MGDYMKKIFEKTKKKLEEIKSKQDDTLDDDLSLSESILGSISLLMGFTVLGGMVMRSLGTEFTSLGGMIVFFIFFDTVWLGVSIIMSGLISSLVFFHDLELTIARIMYVILSTSVSIVIFYWADYFIGTVTTTPTSVLFISFLLALMTFKLVDGNFDDL